MKPRLLDLYSGAGGAGYGYLQLARLHRTARREQHAPMPHALRPIAAEETGTEAAPTAGTVRRVVHPVRAAGHQPHPHTGTTSEDQMSEIDLDAVRAKYARAKYGPYTLWSHTEIEADINDLADRVADLESQLAEAESRAERAEREWQIADHRMTDMLKVVEADLAHAVDAYDAAGKGETDDPSVAASGRTSNEDGPSVGTWDRARLEAEFAEMTTYVQTINDRTVKAIRILDDSWAGRERPDPLVRSLYAVLEPDSWLGRDDVDSRAGQAGGKD